MIYIVHGEDLSSSRKFIKNLQEQNNISVRSEFKLDEISPKEFSQKVSAVDMFGDRQMLVLDVSGMGRTNVDDYVDVLTTIDDDFLVVILSSKDLSKANKFIKSSTKLKARVMYFKKLADSNIFKFADFVFEGNRKMAYSELKKLTLSGEDPIYIFTMLLYNLRNLALCKFNSSEYSKLAPFVKSKVSRQEKSFNEDQIKKIYKEFYKLDKGSKIGTVEHELLVPMAVEKVLTYF